MGIKQTFVEFEEGQLKQAKKQNQQRFVTNLFANKNFY